MEIEKNPLLAAHNLIKFRPSLLLCMLPGFLLPNTGIPRSKKGAIDSSCKSKLSSIPCFFNIPPSSLSNTAVVWRKVVLVQKMILIHSRLLKILFFGQKTSPKVDGLKFATLENLKWECYVRRSKNTNRRPLEPLWGSKRINFSTKRRF